MTPRGTRYIQFISAAVVARFAFGLGFPLWARVNYRDESVAESLADMLKYIEPIWQAFEVLPFVLLGIICGSLSQQVRAIGVFSTALVAFSAIYYVGYMNFEAYMLRHAWTAASLAAGFVPMKCLGVVFIAFLVRLALGTLHVPAKA